MKPTPKKPTTPRGRVSASMTNGLWSVRRSITSKRAIPCSVIPHANAQQARAFVKFWNMTQEERVEKLAKDMRKADKMDDYWHPSYLKQAKAVLAAIYRGGK